MTRVLIIESCEKELEEGITPSIVHVRNSVIMSEELGYDLLTHESQIEVAAMLKYDVIICAYASPYMKYQKYMRILDNNLDAKVFWMVNDHDIEDNILLRNWVKKYHKKYHVICNNPRAGYRQWILRKKLEGKTLDDWIDEWHTVNLNVLIFDIEQARRPIKNRKGIIYYGTYRKHRVDDLLRFNGADYTLSASKKNHDKFVESGIRANYIDKLTWGTQKGIVSASQRLESYKYSLYLEDKHTHDNYAFLANRFYEALNANVIMLYDVACYGTLFKSGILYNAIQVVGGADEVKGAVTLMDEDPALYLNVVLNQRLNIVKAVQERKQVINQLRTIIEGETNERTD